MRLGEQQELFMRLLPDLLDHIHEQGYEVRGGDLFRDSRLHGVMGIKIGYGHRNSNHKQKLAIDLYLTKDGVYLTGLDAKTAHNLIHDHWDTIGGGSRIPHDLNHYSLERDGML